MASCMHLNVDMRIYAALTDKLEFWQALQQGGTNFRALAAQDQHFGVFQTRGKCVRILHMIVPDLHLMASEFGETCRNNRREWKSSWRRPSIILSSCSAEFGVCAYWPEICCVYSDGSDRVEKDMPDIEPLILDLLEWLDKEPRPYFDVMEAWRTSCPRLPAWEDFVDRGFVARERLDGRDASVQLTIEGREFLYKNRPQLSPQTGKGK